MLSNSQRFSRQLAIIHPAMAQATVIVAGAGMLGSWTVYTLSRAVGRVIVYDGGDKVEAENIGNQAYSSNDIGMSKAWALEHALYGLPVKPIAQTFPDGVGGQADVVVSCVDTLKGRREIARWCIRQKVPLFIDTRALGEMAAICTADTSQIKDYLRDMPTEREVEQDLRCGATGGAYTGLWVASQVAGMINSWYRGVRLPKMVVYHVGLGQEVNREAW